jgi:hypothetical protein
MANPTPSQVRNIERVEGLIALAAPFLDLLLAAGDRLSRALGPPAADEPHWVRAPIDPRELAAGPGASESDT